MARRSPWFPIVSFLWFYAVYLLIYHAFPVWLFSTSPLSEHDLSAHVMWALIVAIFAHKGWSKAAKG